MEEGGVFGPLDQSSLVQLVNRAGRGSFASAFVYCSTSEFEQVKTLIKEDPRVAVDQVHDTPFGNLRQLAKEKGAKEGLKEAFKRLIGL